MSNNDEFERLITNFNLDDKNQQHSQGNHRRRAYDYEAENQRMPVGAFCSEQPPAEDEKQPFAPKPQSFHVKIDDNKFYEPSVPNPPSQDPPNGGGTGGNGDHYNNDDEDDESDSGGFSRWMKALIVLAVVLGISVFLAIFALASAQDLFGLNQKDMEIEFTLPPEQSMSQIAGLLKDQGIIDQPLTFRIYAGLKNNADDFLPGDYALNSNMSYDEIMVKFRTPNGGKKEEISLMFPEGMTLKDIAEKLEENDVCKANELYEYLEEGDFPWEYEALADVPQKENRFRRYEGYMFPDTYIFYKGMSPEAVSRKFFSNFNNKIAGELSDEIENSGMTVDEVITMASLIQREAASVNDMKMVSSVFHNRIENPQVNLPRLESDPSIHYVEDDIKPFMEIKNQSMYDDYNTYKCNGLPAGPICNPGMDAIKAAMHPEDSDFFYFLSDRDGKFYFAKTRPEHDANIQKAGIGAHGTGINESDTDD